MSMVCIDSYVRYQLYCMTEFECRWSKPGPHYKMLQALLCGDLALYHKIARRRSSSAENYNSTLIQKKHRNERRIRNANGGRRK